MEKYTVKSNFTVAGQLTHVVLTQGKNTRIIELPAKWAPYLTPGTRVQVFTSHTNGRPIAYEFKNQLYFTEPLDTEQQARRILNGLNGVRKYSLEKLRFKYALLMTLQSVGIKNRMSWVQNMMALYHVNQR